MVVLLVGAAVAGYKLTPAAVPCVSLRYTIEDAAERMYLTEGELNAMLRAENLYPVGQAMNAVSLHRIETVIRKHPMVRTAECYLTPRNEVTDPVKCVATLTPARLVCGDAYLRMTTHIIKLIRS